MCSEFCHSLCILDLQEMATRICSLSISSHLQVEQVLLLHHPIRYLCLGKPSPYSPVVRGFCQLLDVTDRITYRNLSRQLHACQSFRNCLHRSQSPSIRAGSIRITAHEEAISLYLTYAGSRKAIYVRLARYLALSVNTDLRCVSTRNFTLWVFKAACPQRTELAVSAVFVDDALHALILEGTNTGNYVSLWTRVILATKCSKNWLPFKPWTLSIFIASNHTAVSRRTIACLGGIAVLVRDARWIAPVLKTTTLTHTWSTA